MRQLSTNLLSTRQANRTVPMFEQLESRRLLSGGTEHPVPQGINEHGTLTIVGTAANDVIKLSVNGDHFTVVKNGESHDFARADVKGAIVYGGMGDDDLEVDNANGMFDLPVVLIGGQGNDTLIGGGGRDYLLGNDGNDKMDGMGGADTMMGGGGVDNMSGGAGGDRIDGETGNDKLNGDGGCDNMRGGPGKDRLNGGAGNDRLDGGSGVDHIDGGSGSDHLKGGSGTDQITDHSGKNIFDSGDAKKEHVNIDVQTTTGGDEKKKEHDGDSDDSNHGNSAPGVGNSTGRV